MDNIYSIRTTRQRTQRKSSRAYRAHDAWKEGKRWQAVGHAGLAAIEAVSLKRLGKGAKAGKAKGKQGVEKVGGKGKSKNKPKQERTAEKQQDAKKAKGQEKQTKLLENGNYTNKNNSSILGWSKNSEGHLIKHSNTLGFTDKTPQQLQRMLPELRSAANKLLNEADPTLTRIGQWHQFPTAIMRISNGKMLVTQADGTFITVINKTSNNWYQKANPLN